MADKSFEQRVREELGSLKMRPDEAVWKNVEAGLHKEKKRRWLVWVLLFAGLGGGALWYALNEQGSVGTKEDQRAGQEKVYAADQKNKTGNNTGTEDKTAAIKENGETKAGYDPEQAPGQKIIIEKNVIASIRQKQRKQFAERKVEAAFKNKRLQTFTSVSGTDKPKAHKAANIPDEKPSDPDAVKGQQEGDTSRNDVVSAGVNKDMAIKETSSEKNISGNPGAANPVAGPEKGNAPTVPGDTAASTKTTTAKKETRSKWQFSIAGDIGRSALVNGLFANSSASNPSNANPSPPNTAPGNGATAGSSSAPAVRNAFGFGLRMEVGKALNKNLDLRLFAGYSLLQTATKTGRRYSIASVFPSGFYYANTDSAVYTNRYHYVSLGAELSNSFKLFGTTARWNFGGGLDYLFASNALHYDYSTGVLYKNNDLLRKAQPFLSTGIDVAIGKKTFMYVGPTLQYQLRSLGTETSDHLLFGSLRFSFVVPKKK